MKELHPWNLADEKKVFDCPFLGLYERRFIHPVDHREGLFYILDSKDWVQIIAVTPEKNIVLVKQFRFGIEQVTLETPGGIIDLNEDPIHAAVRELSEETGYAGENPRYLTSIYPNPALQNNRLHIVLIDQCRKVGAQHLDPNEEITCEETSLQDCLNKISSGEINHGIAILALLTYAHYCHEF